MLHCQPNKWSSHRRKIPLMMVQTPSPFLLFPYICPYLYVQKLLYGAVTHHATLRQHWDSTQLGFHVSILAAITFIWIFIDSHHDVEIPPFAWKNRVYSFIPVAFAKQTLTTGILFLNINMNLLKDVPTSCTWEEILHMYHSQVIHSCTTQTRSNFQ